MDAKSACSPPADYDGPTADFRDQPAEATARDSIVALASQVGQVASHHAAQPISVIKKGGLQQRRPAGYDVVWASEELPFESA